MKHPMLSRRLAAAIMASFVPFSVAAAAPVATTTSTATTTRITNLKTKGAAEIDRRLTHLATAGELLASSKRLTDTDKSALAKQVSDESTGLTALKTKLAAETTITGARADVASIVTDYRVYVLMLPKVRLVVLSDRIDSSASELAELASRLTTRVSAAKSAGHDVAALETALNDLKAKVASAQTKTDGVVAKLLAVQPSDYNTSHSVLTGYRQTLAAAVTDLRTARDDAKTVVNGLKGF